MRSKVITTFDFCFLFMTGALAQPSGDMYIKLQYRKILESTICFQLHKQLYSAVPWFPFYIYFDIISSKFFQLKENCYNSMEFHFHVIENSAQLFIMKLKGKE